MKLQILIPQYKETEAVVKPLLDSIAIQQNVNFDDIGVIICNDGSDVKLSKAFFYEYPFKIEYYECEHRGVSATRNACLDHATADYVMFCDADDMFYNVSALFLILKEMEGNGFNTLVSAFVEEGRNPVDKSVMYHIRGMVTPGPNGQNQGNIDITFVHGKVHNRQYLLDNKIRWNDSLTIHEDSYFNCLCIQLSPQEKVKFCPNPFYLWKWRDESVCRHDPKYILKTYNNMLDSNTALVNEFIARGKNEQAQFFATSMIYDAYFTMNKKEWINQENKEYRDNTERRFKRYFTDFITLFSNTPEQIKQQIIVGIKNRFFQEGMFMESITFDDWIKHILEL